MWSMAAHICSGLGAERGLRSWTGDGTTAMSAADRHALRDQRAAGPDRS
jgi:hypothetical protein